MPLPGTTGPRIWEAISFPPYPCFLRLRYSKGVKPADFDRNRQLWETVNERCVDREALQAALARVQETEMDARTKQLREESLLALQGLRAADPRFPSLLDRLGTSMKKATIEQYLRELGEELQKPTDVIIGGSSALILQGLLSRNTEDIDLVDQVPEPIRALHKWREKANQRYGLLMAHFQSHYLPQGWEKRVHSTAPFGKLRVFLVDPIDIFVGKTFSKRDKDLDDLRDLSQVLPKTQIDQRLSEARQLWSDSGRRQQGERNYYIVYGERLE
jgi:uncharacterized nucleotidyltransferase DUF6036